MASNVREWTDVVRRARLGRTVKSVAFALSTYANFDGTNVFPGIARVAVDCEISYKVAERSVSTLRSLGLITKVRVGARRKGFADEYHLTIPADLLERVEVLDPDRVRKEADRLRESAGKPPRRGRRVTPTSEATDDVVGVTWSSLEGGEADGCRGHGVTPDSGCRGHGSALCRGHGVTPHQDSDQNTTPTKTSGVTADGDLQVGDGADSENRSSSSSGRHTPYADDYGVCMRCGLPAKNTNKHFRTERRTA